MGGYKANNPCEDLAVGVQSLAEVEVWGLELEEFEGRENRAVAVQRHSHDVRFASRTITLASGNTGKEQPSLLAWYASHSQSDSAGLGSYRALGPQEKSESVSCSVQSNSLQPHEPGCSVRGILQCLLHWKAGSLPLDPQWDKHHCCRGCRGAASKLGLGKGPEKAGRASCCTRGGTKAVECAPGGKRARNSGGKSPQPACMDPWALGRSID